MGTAMLDSKRHHSAFPDQKSERQRIAAVLDALEKLEREFSQHIQQSRVGTAQPDADSGEEQ